MEEDTHHPEVEKRSERYRNLAADVARGWWNADTFEKGAALSFYVVFSAGPIALLLICFAGMAFGELAAKGMLFSGLSGVLGPDIARALDAMLASARRPNLNSLTSVIAGVTLLFVATGVFTQLKYSLNQIYEVPSSGSVVGSFIRRRITAFLAIVLLGIILLAGLTADIAISAAGDFVARWVSLSAVWLRWISFILSLCLLTCVLFLLLKFLPDSSPCWKPALGGATVTAFLFTIGKVLMSLYLGKTAVISVYGAAGSIIVLLLAAYYFSQIFFLGAVLCRELSRRELSQECPPSSKAA